MRNVFFSFIPVRISGDAPFLPNFFLHAKSNPARISGGLTEFFTSGREYLFEHPLESFPEFFRNAVDDPPALPDIHRQFGFSENAELMGDPGLLHPEDIDELTNAEVPLEKETQNSQPGRVGEGLECLDGVCH
jgi:hypothetical protein